jgi:1-acyl-sn-glycerol-3-phosphate acyltransferase
MMNPIAIDRGSGIAALKQTLDQGKDRLSQGFWIVIFPEGTRIAPGERGRYHVGGAWLALKTGAPVVPIAHNAGYLWGKNAFVKYPGMITVRIGAPIAPHVLKAEELSRRVEDWIENEVARLPDPRSS